MSMFIVLALLTACALDEPALRLECDVERGGITFLGWDTEGGGQVARNLLGNSVALYAGEVDDEVRFTITSLNEALGETVLHGSGAGWDIRWTILHGNGGLQFQLECLDAPSSPGGPVQMVFSFDPRVTPVTVLPALWEAEGAFHLPAVVSAPDHGQMLLSCQEEAPVRGHLVGSRAEKTVDLRITLPLSHKGEACALSFAPVHLPVPPEMEDTKLWTSVRRAWFGAFQCTAEWGDSGNPFSAPAGMLGNNVISDPASCSLWFYADQAFFTPELAPGISAMRLVRHTLDWWLDHKMLPHGEMICYWDKTDFLDANSGPIIAAWDYVEITGDLDWLERRIERIERLAEFLAGRDTDGDGLVEAVQSGNYGSLQQPGRSCAWWDALNCGHKDSYSNALIYRAWRCLADLEAKMGRKEAQARYTLLADRLQASFFKTLYNADTGWLAWWKSEDGVLHDYASPVINGLAIEYGLVPPDQAGAILGRIWEKIEEAGFTRFDLGVPPMLTPVLRADYLQPDAIGIPEREDGTDTFGYYMNGGITAGQVLHFLAAHYVADRGDQADRVLRAMLKRVEEGGFQNGTVNAYPHGIDWTTWDGQPAGYEGYLADSFRFLQAILLRETSFREKLYRPMHNVSR
jgi:hypothetical protein